MRTITIVTLAAISFAAINTPAFAWSEWVSHNGGKPVCEAHEGSTTMAGTYKDQKCGLLAFKATNDGVLVRHVAGATSAVPAQAAPQPLLK